MGERRAVDVLVIGSGGAGLRAAIEAAGAGCSTLVLSKGRVDRSGATLLAGANISADVECDGGSLFRMGFPEAAKDDTKEAWFEEIVHQGMYLNNQKLVQIYVDDAPDRVRELIDWGVKVYRLESGRGISISSREILDAMMARVKAAGAQWESDVEVVDLLVADGRVAGALGVRVHTGEYVTYSAKSVVLATGGWHSLYPFTSGGSDLTGDGQAMAYRAGAELINMEMVTFCPNTVLEPRRYRGSIVPYCLHTSGYGHLLNRKGEEFLGRYFDPEMMDLALHTEWNKLLVSFAEFKEIEREGTENGGVYFSMKHCPNEVFATVLKEMPGLKQFYQDMVARLESGYSVEVAPGTEYFEGGIKVDERYRTTLPGLYAAGECTGGTFGSNRVSAATTEMLVQGRRAGWHAAEEARRPGPAPDVDAQARRVAERADAPFGQPGAARPGVLRRQLGELAARHVSLIRTGEGLREARAGIREIRRLMAGDLGLTLDTRTYNLEWLDFLTLRNLVDVLEMSAGAAELRAESRGVHYRDDHPFTDDDHWLKCITVAADGGTMTYAYDPVVATRVALPTGRAPYHDYIKQLAAQYV
ncbi:MAG: FAD-dependent oxidoreductase [Holophaga sp.]|jgi:succinate dehydrogenase/fumarate reductase flavoprotein subunit